MPLYIGVKFNQHETIMTPDDAASMVKDMPENEEIGEVFELRVVKMTEEEFEKLPHFDGY